MNTLPIASNFRIIAKPHPLSMDAVECDEGIFGSTIRDVIGCEGDSFVVALNDRAVPSYEWSVTRPLPGDVLHVVPVPQNDNARTLLLTAGLVAAAVFGGGALAGLFKGGMLASHSFWANTIMAVGSLTMTALVQPPRID